jgi:protein TonB
VVLRVLVGYDGTARQILLHQSSGHKVLDEAARKAVITWRFLPARRGDTPVESWVDIPIRFDLRG